MDAKRLEEIVQWAHDQSIEQTIDGSSVAADYLADLARCAAAWAKVERELSVEGGQFVILVRGFSGIFYTTRRVKLIQDTAIEAVEAAPEVKP
jgi:hypothetical protein